VEPIPPAIVNFLGYGNLAAPLWFLGMEEAAQGETCTIEENVAIRAASFRQTMGLHEAQALLRAPVAARGRITSVWTFMAKLARGIIDGAADWDDRAEARSYVNERLGTPSGGTLLAELMPLPAPNASGWPTCYERWHPSRAAYEDVVRDQRVGMLRTALEGHSPRVVIAYGLRHWDHYRRVVGATEWTSIATERAPIELTGFNSGRSIAVLTPFFGNGAMGNDDVRAIVEAVRAVRR
jgi:hypothetical protein